MIDNRVGRERQGSTAEEAEEDTSSTEEQGRGDRFASARLAYTFEFRLTEPCLPVRRRNFESA